MAKSYIDEAQRNLRENPPEPEALQLISEAMARKYIVIPLSVEGNVLRVAMANPTDILALEALASWSKMRIEPEVASTEDILEAIDFNYKGLRHIVKSFYVPLKAF